MRVRELQAQINDLAKHYSHHEAQALHAQIRDLAKHLPSDPSRDRSRAYTTRRVRLGAQFAARSKAKARQAGLAQIASLRAQLKALTNPSQGAKP